MIKYQIKIIKEEIEKKIPEYIECDVCGKKYKCDKDGNWTNIYEVQEFTIISKQCGYGSIFGDGDIIECHICQHCLKNKLGQYIRCIGDYSTSEEKDLGKIYE